jgi:RNA polymerase primary sigma factor
MKSASFSLINAIGKTKLLTKEEEQELSRKIKKGDKSARDRMIKANLRLAMSVAKKYSNRGVDLEDLFQESIIGLTHAVDRFDWTRGFKFSTYAYWWIQQSVRQYLAANCGPIDLPSNTFFKLYKIAEFEKDYQKQFGRHPTSQETANMFNTTSDTLASLRQSAASSVSLNQPRSTRSDDAGIVPLADLIPADNIEPEEKIDNDRLRLKVHEAMQTLTSREKTIIKMRFGLKKDQVDI